MILSFLAVSILVMVESDRKYKDINYVSFLLFVVRLLMQHESFFDCKLLIFCCFVLIDIKLINLFSYTACVPPGDSRNGSSGFLASPNFPNNFPTDSNCTWNITVPAGLIIKVTFLSFALDPSDTTDCSGVSGGPRVFITNVTSDDGNQEFKICGAKRPAPVYSVGNFIQVRLQSTAVGYQRFNASYEAINGERPGRLGNESRPILLKFHI